MKNTTRRNLLTKLGAGAAALAALTVAGTPNLASAQLVPMDPKRTVKIELPASKLQVLVSFGPNGLVVNSKASDAPLLGISKDNKTLRLGVQFNQQSVAITGLDAVVNRAAGSGRCTIDVDVEEVNMKF